MRPVVTTWEHQQSEARIQSEAILHQSAETKNAKAGKGAQSQGGNMNGLVCSLWAGEEGQDIAEYAVMLAVILVIVVGTLRLIGSNTNNVFSSVASTLQ